MTAIELRAELFREMSPLLDNESAMTKMLAFVKSLVPAKKAKTESDWANRAGFCEVVGSSEKG